jgi:predicted transcriptional regulator
MDDTCTLTIRLPKVDLDRLDALASSTKRSKSSLAAEAVEAYLAAQDWQIATISEAVEAADGGAIPVEHAAVKSWLQSWGNENELPRPR